MILARILLFFFVKSTVVGIQFLSDGNSSSEDKLKSLRKYFCILIKKEMNKNMTVTDSSSLCGLGITIIYSGKFYSLSKMLNLQYL